MMIRNQTRESQETGPCPGADRKDNDESFRLRKYLSTSNSFITLHTHFEPTIRLRVICSRKFLTNKQKQNNFTALS